MTVVKYKSMTEVLAEQLRKSIIIGEFPPGMRLTESDIAQKMGVSRMVVREAMLMLIHEGLLIKKPNRHTSVVSLDIKDIEDIYDMRIAIEQGAARLCINEPEFIKVAAKRCDAIKKLSANKLANPDEIIKADMAFHTYMVESSNNSRMVNVWNELYSLMLLLLYQYLEKSEYKLNLSHDEIVNSFKGGDLTDICKEIHIHIEDAKNELIKQAKDSR